MVALLSWFDKCYNQDLLSLQELRQPQFHNIGLLPLASNFACSSLFFASLFLRLLSASLLPASTFFGFFVVTRSGSFVICNAGALH